MKRMKPFEGMKKNSLACDDIRRYQFWEWTQGVGLFGYWKPFQATGEERYLSVLNKYYERQFAINLPAKNVNTMTPMLPLSFLAGASGPGRLPGGLHSVGGLEYDGISPEPRREGLQHITSDSVNKGELWDDTLFMTVLFLANMGRILDRKDYKEEAQYRISAPHQISVRPGDRTVVPRLDL